MIPRQSLVASEALQCIERVQGRGYRAEYRTRANSFPTMIVQSGLAQAYGFLLAKRKDGNGSLAEAYGAYLADVLRVARAGWRGLPEQPDEFYKQLVSADLRSYRRMARALLDAALWLKMLAQAHLQQGDRSTP